MKQTKLKSWLKKQSPIKEPPNTNPYLNARRAWNSHVAGLMKSVQLWQFIGLASLLINLTAVSGLISIGRQSKFIPLVFQQDAHGNTLSVTQADKVSDATLEDYRTVAAHFIEHIRMVTADAELQKKAVLQTYSYLSGNDAATRKVQEFYNGSIAANPFNRATHEIVSVEIQSVLKESEHSWQVIWTETVRHRDGSLNGKPLSMKALLTLYQHPQEADGTNAILLTNPHFIFVRDFNWSRDLESGVNP